MTQATPGYRAVLRIRDYRLLLSGLGVSQIGSWAFNVALAVFVFDSTHSAVAVGIASLGRFGTALVSSAYGGVIAERFERVRLMVALDSISFVLMCGLAVIAAFSGPVSVAIVVAALTTAVGSAYSPAAKATTPVVVGTDLLAPANGLESTVENLAIVTGPAIGAGLLILGPPAVAFAVNAATFAYSAVAVSRLHARSQPVDVSEGGSVGPLAQVLTGVRAMAESRAVMVLVIFSVLASFVYGTDTVLFVLVSQSLLHTGSDGYGYLLAGLGIGGLAAASLTNRMASSPRLGTLIVVALGVYCLPTALLTVVHQPAVAFLLQIVRGAGTLVVDVLAVTAMQRTVAPHVVARVFGAFFTLVLAAIAVGAIVTPLLVGAIGLDATLLVMGLAVPAAVLLLYPAVRSIDTSTLAHLAELEPRIALLEQLQLFDGADRPALERLAAAAREVRFTAGAVILRQGDAADDLYIIKEGSVDISARAAPGAGRSLGRVDAPAYVGEIGLLEHVPRTATVAATTPVVAYRIAGEEFLDALTTTPLSPGALGLAQTRLARTHPSRGAVSDAGRHALSEAGSPPLG